MDVCDYRYMDRLFLDEFKAMDSLNVTSSKELKVTKVSNGVIIPYKNVDGIKYAGVVNHKGAYEELSKFEALSPVDSWEGAYDIGTNIEHIEENVIYMGRFWKHWGHFIMDMVSRLWYAIEIDKTTKIVYDGDTDISGVYLEFMKLAGIEKERLLRVDKPVRFNNIIVPECSYKPGISCNIRYKNIFDVVANNAMKEQNIEKVYQGEKIYFTRTGIKNRVPLEVGEKDIEKIFRDNGYRIISPERYSLVQQIVMIRQAEEIACVAGTLPHNMMFAKDESKLTIVRKTNKPNYRQTDVNNIRGLKVTNVDAHISPLAVGPAGPFILDINENVKRYFADRNMVVNFSGFKSFWKRKARLLWYIPLYVTRNFRRKREIPLFDGKGFGTRPEAKKELFRFYWKRF